MLSSREISSIYLEPSKENVLRGYDVLREYDALALTMLYLKVLPDIASQNS